MSLADKLYGKNVDKSKKRKKIAGPSFLTTILQTIHIMENEILRLKLQESPPDVLIEPQVDFVTLLEFHKAIELIGSGEVAAAGKMVAIKKLLNIKEVTINK